MAPRPSKNRCCQPSPELRGRKITLTGSGGQHASGHVHAADAEATAGNTPEPEAVAPARAWLDLSDRGLLAQCEVDAYRASGPGGQKRNKTSSAVRLRHGPTGLIVIAEESRSQHENKARAVRRLREAIALTQRHSVDPGEPLPRFLAQALARGPGLRVSPRHADYFRIVQYLLDLLHACRGSVADAARIAGLSTAQLVRFLHCDSRLWVEVNRLRAGFGLRPLS